MEMERWEKPPARRNRNSPSFSSSLLDAIYRSIDETDVSGGFSSAAAKDQFTGGAPKERAAFEKAVTRSNFSASSSSDSSTYGFSSDTESAVFRTRPKPVRTGPVLNRSDRIRSDPPPPPKKEATSIRKKFRDFKNSTAPSSPGARLAGFLNSIFTAAARNPKKPKIATRLAADSEPPSTACSSASSCSRSCLSKTPSSRGSNTGGSSGGKRSVRFCPVGVIVGEDCRPCGQKFVFDGDLYVPTATAAAARRSKERKKVVEELLRGLEFEDDDESDSSSDLFELENLSAIGGYSDELPVYETTDFGTNRAIARGLIL